MSVHWDVYTTPKDNKSSVYCNGKKLTSFTSKTVSGNTSLAIGDMTKVENSPLDGSIIFFSVLKYKKMTEKEILTYHYLLCNLYNVDHDPINV